MPHALARQLVAAYPDVWAPRMRILLSGRGGHNEGTVVAAWNDESGTLVVRWDSGTRESPIADLTRPWTEEPGGPLACVATRPVVIVPDLDDPATGGILLARLWTIDPRARVDRYDDVVRVTVHGKARGPVDYEDRDDGGRWWFYVTGPTLGHACASALVAIKEPR